MQNSNQFTSNIIKHLRLFAIISLLLLSCKDDKSKGDPPSTNDIFTVNSSGGTFIFDNGITMTVPEDAISEDIDISVMYMEQTAEDIIFGDWAQEGPQILFSIEATPDGQTFEEPVEVRVPDTGITPGDWVIVYLVDPATGSLTPADLEFTTDPSDGSITLALSHFSSYSAEAVSELKAGICASDPGNCRCGPVRVLQKDKNNICGEGECQYSESDLVVTFLSCGENAKDTAFFSEYSDSCSPTITVNAADATIPACSSTSVTATVKIGCNPQSGQTVDFVAGSLGVMDPTFGIAGNSGSFTSTFTAGKKPGTETIAANATVSFYKYRISASTFEGLKETNRGPMSTKSVSGSAQVTIEPDDLLHYPKAIWGVTAFDTLSGMTILVVIDFQNNDPYLLYTMDPDSTNAACSISPNDDPNGTQPHLALYYRVQWSCLYQNMLDRGTENTTHTLTVSTGATTGDGYPLLVPVAVSFVPSEIVASGSITGP